MTGWGPIRRRVGPFGFLGYSVWLRRFVMGKTVFGLALVGVGAYFLLRKSRALSGLGAPPEVHRQEAAEDIRMMAKLVGETEQNVRAGRCKDALSSAGKAAVASGKVERNLEYVDSSVKSNYRTLNDRRMKSRDDFAAACMR